MGASRPSHGYTWLRFILVGVLFNVSHCLSGPIGYMYTETTAVINVTYVTSNGQFYTESSESGKFASKSPTETEKGRLVYWVDRAGYTDACSLDDYDPASLPKDEIYIILISRLNCSYADKVKNAQRLNGTAAVIFNTESDDVTAMQTGHIYLAASWSPLETGNKEMVSVMIGKSQGEKLVKLLLNGTRVMMYINVGSMTMYPYTVSQASVILRSISVIVLMVIFLVWLIFYYIRSFRYNRALDRTQRRLGNIAKKAVTNIPQKTLRKGDKELHPEYDNGSVCLESYKSSDVLRLLPCNHEFHEGCIDQWLLDHQTCPMCTLNILKVMRYNPTGDLKDEQSVSTSGSNFVVGPPSLAAAVAMSRNEDASHYDDGRTMATGGVNLSEAPAIDDVIDFNDVPIVITERQSPDPNIYVAEVTYESLQDPDRNRLNHTSISSSVCSDTDLHNSTGTSAGDSRSYQGEEPTSQLII